MNFMSTSTTAKTRRPELVAFSVSALLLSLQPLLASGVSSANSGADKVEEFKVPQSKETKNSVQVFQSPEATGKDSNKTIGVITNGRWMLPQPKELTVVSLLGWADECTYVLNSPKVST